MVRIRFSVKVKNKLIKVRVVFNLRKSHTQDSLYGSGFRDQNKVLAGKTHVYVCTGAVLYRGPRPSPCSFSTHILHSVVEGPLSLWVLFVHYSGIKEPTVQPGSALPQSSSCISSPQHHCDGQAAGRRKRESMRKGREAKK